MFVLFINVDIVWYLGVLEEDVVEVIEVFWLYNLVLLFVLVGLDIEFGVVDLIGDFDLGMEVVDNCELVKLLFVLLFECECKILIMWFFGDMI